MMRISGIIWRTLCSLLAAAYVLCFLVELTTIRLPSGLTERVSYEPHVQESLAITRSDPLNVGDGKSPEPGLSQEAEPAPVVLNPFEGLQCNTPRAWPSSCAASCVTGRGAIPRIVHFIQIGDKLAFSHWLAVLSAVRFVRPRLVLIHHIGEQTTCWAKRIRQNPLVRFSRLSVSSVPVRVNGVRVAHPAHRSDFLRLALLWQYGGVYMDTDAVLTRAFDPLLTGREAVVSEQFDGRIANGIIAARNRSCFVCEFAYRSCRNFNGSWAAHSITTLTEMVSRGGRARFPAMDVLPASKGFFPFNWKPKQLKKLFFEDASRSDFLPGDVFAIHLFNSKSARMTNDFSYREMLASRRTPFALVARQLLPAGFRRQHMDAKKCTAISN